jgi:hypothetical protein
MVREINDASETGGKPYIRLTVIRMPSDHDVVAGDIRLDDPRDGKVSVRYGKPLEITQARIEAHKLASEKKLDFVLIGDPKNLFPPSKRPPLP